MKKLQQTLLIVFLSLTTWMTQAQQVNTLYFLENAPMRHVLNPALVPVSDGYINFTPLGYMSLAVGLPLTPQDLIYKDATGKYITALYSRETQDKLLKAMRKSNLTYTDFNLGILNFGFRVKEVGYVYVDMNLHGEIGLSLPKPNYILGGTNNNYN